MAPQFLFVTCQVGAEPALKKEIARDHPNLRFSYSRPGFVTFKWDGVEGEFGVDYPFQSVFARAWGISLGKIKADPEDLPKLIFAKAEEIFGHEKGLRLHVWERDLYAPEMEPIDYEPGKFAKWARREIMKVSGEKFSAAAKAENEEIVFDVVVVEENEWWLGQHRHNPKRSAFPGGRPDIALPAGAPSRAYLKIEEGILWSGANVQPGQFAVEVGSAPGGASFALLERGLLVTGIDPAAMDPRILNHENFRHAQLPVNHVDRDKLPEDVHWLLLDMNVEPAVSLFAVDRLISRMHSSLLGVFLTIKLNKWEIADEIPGMLEHIRSMRMVDVRATQLPSNRQEIFVAALTRKGILVRQGNETP